MEFFAAAFFVVQFLRTPPPPIAWWVVAGVLVGATAAAGREIVAATRAAGTRGASFLAAGALAASLSPPPTPPAERPRATTLEATTSVVSVTGVVDEDLSRPDEPARFRLGGGLVVRVFGAASAPAPGTRLSAVGRLDADGARLDVFDPAAMSFSAPPAPFSIAAATSRLRRAALDRLARAVLDPEARGLTAAAAFGTPSLPAALRDDLVRSGTLHLIAVSGTHLALLAAGLRRATPRLRIVIPALAIYAGVAGFAPPVLRSLLLATAVSVGRRCGGFTRPFAHLALVACAVCALDPEAPFDPGFQLSFAAFAGLAAAERPPKPEDPFAAHDAPDARRRLRDALRGGAAATLAAAPTTAWFFGRLTPLAPAATLVLAPLVPALLATAAAAVAFPECAAPGRWAEFLTATTRGLVAVFAAIPGAGIDLARPAPFSLAVFCAALTATIVRLRRGGDLRASGVALCGAFALLSVPDRAPPGCYVLDARRGSAALLLGRASAVLVDAGPPEADVAGQLLRLGVDRLDAVVLSHAHQDHAGGLAAVRRRLVVGEVLAPAAEARLLRAAGAGPVAAVARGAFRRFGDVRLDLRWPPARYAPRDRNDAGLVVAAAVGGLRVLLPGDLEEPGLRALMKSERLGRADLLLLPHHGSANHALRELLAAVRPAAIAVSARAGFPAPETLRAAAAAGAEVRATFVSGTLYYPEAE